MNSLISNFANWKPFPTVPEFLYRARLVLPVPSGMYGRPDSQIFLTVNHHPTLLKLGKLEGITAWALEGGGYPLEVAVAFDLLKPPFERFVGENTTIYIPRSLSAAWRWRDGEVRLGGTIRVVSNNFPDDDLGTRHGMSALYIRSVVAIRLVLAQILLMVIPIAFIDIHTLVPVFLIALMSSLMLAGFWNKLPGTGWVKGAVIGLFFAGASIFLMGYKLISIHFLMPLGVIIINVWLGGLLNGARKPD